MIILALTQRITLSDPGCRCSAGWGQSPAWDRERSQLTWSGTCPGVAPRVMLEARAISCWASPKPRNAGRTYSRFTSPHARSSGLKATHPAGWPSTQATRMATYGSGKVSQFSIERRETRQCIRPHQVFAKQFAHKQFPHEGKYPSRGESRSIPKALPNVRGEVLQHLEAEAFIQLHGLHIGRRHRQRH